MATRLSEGLVRVTGKKMRVPFSQAASLSIMSENTVLFHHRMGIYPTQIKVQPDLQGTVSKSAAHHVCSVLSTSSAKEMDPLD